MNKQNALTAIEPNTQVAGFLSEMFMREGSFLTSGNHHELLADHHLELNIYCDGSNPKYPWESCLRIKISQLTSDTEVGIRTTNDDSVAIFVLKQSQQLEAIHIMETPTPKGSDVVLIVTVKNHENGVTESRDFCLCSYNDRNKMH